MSDPIPGRRTPISTDPIGIDPIGNDPLDMSDAPPKEGPGPNRTAGGFAANATTFFIAAVVLGVIMIGIVIYFSGRT